MSVNEDYWRQQDERFKAQSSGQKIQDPHLDKIIQSGERYKQNLQRKQQSQEAQPQGPKPQVNQVITKPKISTLQKVKRVLSQIKSKGTGKKVFKNVSGAYGYKAKLSQQFINYGGQSRPLKRSGSPQKGPSQAQIVQRIRFAQMVQRNRQLQQQIKIQQSPSRMLRAKRSGASTPPQMPQYQRPQPRGLWNQDPSRPSNAFHSKMPQGRIWRKDWRTNPDGSPKVFLEGDLMGNIKAKTYGGPDSFFN